jgi:hypothetical protein
VTRTLLPIPARHVPAIFDALLTAYSVKAEAIHRAAVIEAAGDRLQRLRDHRTALLDVDELLEQLDWSPDRRVIDIAGEREVLASIVHEALSTAIEDLDQAGAAYLQCISDLDQIAAANEGVRGLLALLRSVDTNSTGVSTPRFRC